MNDIESLKERLAREADTLDKIGANVDETACMLGCAVDEVPGKLGDSMRDALATITTLQSKLAEAERALGAECGWLIEISTGEFIHYVTLSNGKWPRTRQSSRPHGSDRYMSPIELVKDASAALRFARKADAEEFIRLFDRFLLNAEAVEHEWSDTTLASIRNDTSNTEGEG